MALFVAGKSGNPNGRPKHLDGKGSKRPVSTVGGKVERFVQGYFTRKKMQELCDKLSPRELAEFYTKLAPYVMAPKSSNVLSQEEIDKVYDAIQEALKNEGQKRLGNG